MDSIVFNFYSHNCINIIPIASTMNSLIKMLLILIFLVQATWQSAISASSTYNRFLSVHSHSVPIYNNPGSPISKSYYFTTTFTSTIDVASRVFYSTVNIMAEAGKYAYLNDSSRLNLEYYLEAVNVTAISLVTSIRGVFEVPYFHSFNYRYLLVLDSNPWEHNYMVIENIQFSNSDNQKNINLPNKYVSGNSIEYVVLIRDIKAEFTRAALNSYGNNFYIRWNPSLNINTLTLTLDVPPYFDTYYSQTGIYQIRYLVIIIDLTALRIDYPQYPFQTAQLTGYQSSSYGVSYSSTTPYTNYMFGLSRVRFTLDTYSNFDFTLQYTNNDLTTYFYGYSNSILSFTYAYATFIYLVCPNAYYYLFNGTDHLCYDYTCPQGYYFDMGNQACMTCKFDCLTCNNANQCLTCNTANRNLSDYRCIPLNGLYESNVSIPLSCSLPCSTCFNTDSNCTSCMNNSLILIDNVCRSCNFRFEGCSICSQDYCISCLTNYTLMNSTFCNLPCSDQFCATCSNFNTSYCFVCKSSNYRLSEHHTCIACGNGRLENGEECDDGNSNYHDGCDPECKREANYHCYQKIAPLGYKYILYCAYTHAIEFVPISIEKIDYSNEIAIIISISHYQQSFWKTRAALSYCIVETPIPYRNMRVEFINSRRQLLQTSKLAPLITSSYPQSSLIKITFEYLQSIHHQNINLSFNFSSTTDLALAEIPPSTVSVTVTPGNNLIAHLYTPATYRNQKLLANFFLFLTISALGLFLLSLLVGGKRVIVEMLMVIQITYISLISVPEISPMFSAVSTLSTANNGYNILYNPSLRPFEDTLSDQTVKGTLLYSQFLYNINVGLLFILIPFLVGAIALLLSKVKEFSELKLQKVQNIYRLAFGEYTFVGLIFAGSIIGASAVLEIKFGMKQISSMIGLLSLILTALLLLVYLLYVFIRVRCDDFFDQFKSILIDNSKNKLGLPFQIIYSFLGLLFGVIISAFYSFKLINLVISGIALIFYVITLFTSIYKKQIDHYRTQLNLLTLVLIQIPFFYSNIHSGYEYKEESDLVILLPSLLAVLLAINFLVNISFFVYLFVKKIREKIANNLQKPENEEKMQQSVKEEHYSSLYKNSLLNPLQYLKKPKFINSFIEDSERDIEQAQQKSPIKGKDFKNGFHMNKLKDEPEKVMILEKEYIHNKYHEIDQL